MMRRIRKNSNNANNNNNDNYNNNENIAHKKMRIKSTRIARIRE